MCRQPYTIFGHVFNKAAGHVTVSVEGVQFLSDLDIAGCIFQENVLIEIFNISFESTENKQRHDSAWQRMARGSGLVVTNMLQLFLFLLQVSS